MSGGALLESLFSDPATAARFSDAAQVGAMLQVESALARVQGRLGLIPETAAEAISGVAGSLELDPAALAAGTEAAGVPVPALVSLLRRAVAEAEGPEAADYVHWGATSQDVLDTGLVLRLRALLDDFEARLAALGDSLAALAATHRRTPLAGRTRGQQAVPISFGLEIAGWLLPLLDHGQRLGELRPRTLVVSLGGAAGTLSVFGDRGPELVEALAHELGLGAPLLPWHVRRDGLAELAGWLSLLSGSLGRIGQDVALMAQSEVGELREGGRDRGGSSTMPQKSNPVLSERLVTLARMNATLLSASHQALLQEQQRGGVGWQLEWLTLPRMAELAGASLRAAADLLAGLEVDAGRMRANLEGSRGLVLAEAASFALAAHLPRAEAQRLVRDACEACRDGRHLLELLAEWTSAPVDWHELRDPLAHLGASEVFVDRVLLRHGEAKRRRGPVPPRG